MTLLPSKAKHTSGTFPGQVPSFAVLKRELANLTVS